MGIDDRPWARRAPSEDFARMRGGSVTAWLIFINVLLFVVDNWMLRHRIGYIVRFGVKPDAPLEAMGILQYWGFFSATLAVRHLQLWRFITFQFIHLNLEHIVFNMIALYFFGPMVERALSPRQYLPFYLLCGIGGAVMYLVLLEVGLKIAAPWVPLIGASAGIFGVLVASAMLAPDAVALVFGVIPVRLRVLVWLFIAYAVFQVLFQIHNAGGEAAHLGGAVVGFALIRWPGVLERIAWLGKRAPPF